MIFIWQAMKEAEIEAKKDNGYFTAEMLMGYVMCKCPMQFILSIILPPILIVMLILHSHGDLF